MENSNDFEMFGYFFKRYKWRKGNVLKRENIKIITCSKTNDLVKTIFNYFPLEYQKSLKRWEVVTFILIVYIKPIIAVIRWL